MKPAHLPCKRGKTFEDFHGARALETDGVKLWLEHVRQVAKDLSSALEAEYVVPGSGNAPLLRELLPKVRLGSNEHAFDGAFLLWQKPHVDATAMTDAESSAA